MLKEYKSRLFCFNSCKSHENRTQLINAKKKYKNYESKIKRKYKQHEGDMLDYLKKQNPKHFYGLFSKQKRRHIQSNLTNNDFYMHFKGLIQDDVSDATDEVINDESVYDELDREITYHEIKTAIRKLKLNKSCSEDCILNEVFIYCEETLMPLLHELFNKILKSGLYPQVWSRSCIVPVYKKRSKM